MGNNGNIVLLAIGAALLVVLAPGTPVLASCGHPPLADVDWSYCDKRTANLTDVNLMLANLNRAVLGGVKHLASSQLRSAANLQGVNLSGHHLSRFDLSARNLTGVNLSNATLVAANLSKTNLTNANLARAILMGTDLTNANLTGTILTDAILTGATLTGAIGVSAELLNAAKPGNVATE